MAGGNETNDLDAALAGVSAWRQTIKRIIGCAEERSASCVTRMMRFTLFSTSYSAIYIG